MEVINQIQIVFVLLAAMVALTFLANRWSVPAPLILVPSGVILGFTPWFPRIELNPDLILFVFLPPLVYIGAFSSWQALRKNLKPIFFLSFGLVLFATVVVAVVAHRFIPGWSWAVAFVLGAIVAPTDDVAAAAVIRGFSLPHRIVSVLEGEALLNDATALTAFKFSSAAVVSGSFSFAVAAVNFLGIVLGEVGFGLLLGWVLSKLRQKVKDPTVAIALSFLTPFVAYLPAERLGGSGVLATAVVGSYLGSRRSEILTPGIRLAGLPIWEFMAFILNNLLFLVTGLQLRAVLEKTSDLPARVLFYDGVLISAVVIFSRVLWVFSETYVPRLLSPHLRKVGPKPVWRHVFMISWTGMRGSISLAAAFGIPAATEAGIPFPGRSLIIFIAFCVILSTLVLQGMTLAPLIRWLGVDRDGKKEQRGAHYQEARARIEAGQAAIAEIDTWTKQGACSEPVARQLRRYYRDQIRKFSHHRDEESDEQFAHLSKRAIELAIKALGTERAKVLELREDGAISDSVLRLIELDLDLQEMRLGRDAHSEDN